MKVYTFNRKEFKWAEEFYNIIKQKMNLPDWFGNNADALWDMLTGHIETPCEIVFIGFNKEKNEHNKNTMDLIISCFIDAEKEYQNKFKVTFKD